MSVIYNPGEKLSKAGDLFKRVGADIEIGKATNGYFATLSRNAVIGDIGAVQNGQLDGSQLTGVGGSPDNALADLLDTFQKQATGNGVLIIARPADKSDINRSDIVQAASDGGIDIKATIAVNKNSGRYRYEPV
jgi:hypothetical protein